MSADPLKGARRAEGTAASKTRRNANLRRAIAATKAGKHAQAIELFKWVLIEDEACADAWYGLGYCYYKQRNLTQAILLLKRAEELGHRAAHAIIVRAETRLKASTDPPEEA